MALDLRSIDKLPSEYYGGRKVSEDTSILIQYTAENVCTTCGFADMCANNGNGALYVRCQNPNSLVSARPHNALQGCEGRGYDPQDHIL